MNEIIYTWESKSVMTYTRTKQLQDFYGIKYEELWDEDKLIELGVKEDEIKEIKEIRGKEYAYKDTVGFEIGKGVLESDRFKKLQEHYGITLEDTQSEEKLAALNVPADDIAFIRGKTLKSKAKKDEWTKSKWGTTKPVSTPKKSS